MKLPSQKRKRLVIKQERAVTKGAMEASEGVSYQSGGLSLNDYKKNAVQIFYIKNYEKSDLY